MSTTRPPTRYVFDLTITKALRVYAHTVAEAKEKATALIEDRLGPCDIEAIDLVDGEDGFDEFDDDLAAIEGFAAAYAAWSADVADLSAQEDAGPSPKAKDWHAVEDQAADLLRQAVGLLGLE